MALNLNFLAEKLRGLRTQFQLELSEVAAGTGIDINRLEDFEAGKREPTGDEVLIVSEFYKTDYNFLISNEKASVFEKTEKLFRQNGDDFSKEDRWAVQEFLFLCECEAFLLEQTGRKPHDHFTFAKTGTYIKGQGHQAAAALRQFLGYDYKRVSSDVFADLRKAGIHIFRRVLANSNLSGICILHPDIGPCVLVNFQEDVFRQRFTAAHEGGHAILDTGEEDIFVSRDNWTDSNWSELRANAFASHFLIPPELLKKLKVEVFSDDERVKNLALQLEVSTSALAIALKEQKLITEDRRIAISALRLWRRPDLQSAQSQSCLSELCYAQRCPTPSEKPARTCHFERSKYRAGSHEKPHTRAAARYP